MAVLAFAAGERAGAQTLTNDPFKNLPSEVTAPTEDPDSIQLAFDLVFELPLPGPLPHGGPRIQGNEIEIPVAGGRAVLPLALLEESSVLVTESGSGAAAVDEEWSVSESGRLRFRVDPTGWIRAEKRCKRCERGWKKKWKLRALGAAAAPPLAVGNQVCFGALDNRVYCVKERNGHRRWASQVGGRVTQRLVHWPGPPLDEDDPTEDDGRARGAVVAVLERGARLVLLAEDDGVAIGQLQFGATNGKIVNVPLATPDGRLVLARQGYADSDAKLLVYRLEPATRLREDPADGEADEGKSAPSLQPFQDSW